MMPKKKVKILLMTIVAAYNNARATSKKSSDEISKLTGGVNLPFDIKFPT